MTPDPHDDPADTPPSESLEDLDAALDGGEKIRCWCGAVGTYDELFDDDGLDLGCGGTGLVDCYCGGDLCVCHHHGQEQPCPGCDECTDDDGELDDEEPMWTCGCGVLVDESVHCPNCGGCPPWGCGMDHDDDDDHAYDYDPREDLES